MNLPTGKLRSQKRARRLIREYKCICLLALRLNAETAEVIRKSLSVLDNAPKGGLREIGDNFENEISKVRKGYGVLLSSETVLHIFDQIESTPVGKALLIPRNDFDRIFKHPDQLIEDYYDWPLHSRIEIKDPPQYPPNAQWHLIEAKFFESMAAIFNLANRKQATLTRTKTKIDIKEANALSKAAVTAAMSFIECLINSIGYEYCLENQGLLSKKDVEFLTDTKAKGFVGFRKKLIYYPKVILKETVPPLSESNCPPMKLILEVAKNLRDAVTHPKPSRPIDGAVEIGKEERLLTFSFEDVEEIIDAAVKLADVLMRTVGYSRKRMFWLIARGLDGYFPNQVFD